MARRRDVDERIVRELGRAANGLSVSELGAKLGVARRTLQRQLRGLVAAGRVVASGQTRARVYRTATGPTKDQIREVALVDVVTSQAGDEVRAFVRRPLASRKETSYRREFLDSYRPNKTFYLPSGSRAQLLKEGSATIHDEPAGTYARQILARLIIDLPWNSSRLEGNTYSLLETERLIAFGESAEGKSARDAQMILNHKAAIEFLVEGAADVAFNRYTLLNLHALLAENLLSDPAAGGRLRAIPVGIGGTNYRPLDVPQLVEECFDAIMRKASAIHDPFEQAFFCMVHIPYLQPFEDVNKRVSRLAANIPFIKKNLCPLAFVDVPEREYVEGILGVYELNRVELLRDVFVRAYLRSCARYAGVRHSLGEPDAFRMKYRRELFDLVAAVVRRQMNKKAATRFIQDRARTLPEEDAARFVEIVETELIALHEGNIARYRIRPSELREWEKQWR